MTPSSYPRALTAAVQAARAAGALMRRHAASTKKINAATQHDIKLELDVRCQKLIERALRAKFPEIPILGEEGVLGDPNEPVRWVVDPIDGTVNFTYGIPHACVSIALQVKLPKPDKLTGEHFQSVVGVVFDPFCDELWTAIRGKPARLNGKVIHVSDRRRLDETIIAMGFAKYTETLAIMLPVFNDLVHRVRKVRILGAAALSFTWVATGRMDAYLENGVRLWDIAAGGLIVECAGGEFWHRPVAGEHTYEILATNGRLRKQIQRAAQSSL
ncbi:MAG: inositol monophosphatase family protein [Verrucomicrobiota bacterium]